ncbi:protein slender lobes isoform X1 [Drosophila willistoni]|uniref:protein slender lobes isoform X1 n=1 Tax=Drosophila willistoni TaxID=7260 RepID=UPI001F073D0E|nr:protein slender lobes isoform X1 [Drosophila willistoni]
MEENMENKDGLRVTRARARRLSVLDTDSRPVTPQLELEPDRGTASPRPLRRTRLNSATIDLRTPTRTTRRSVARGETPEPTTPSASATKRPARTPAKSVRKQLPLHEEEEDSNNIKEEIISRTPTPTGEKRVTRSMSKTPPVPPSDKREATVSPAVVKQQQLLSKTTTEPVSQNTPNQGTSKLIVKVSKVSRTLLTSPLTISQKSVESEEKKESTEAVKVAEVSRTLLTSPLTISQKSVESEEKKESTEAVKVAEVLPSPLTTSPKLVENERKNESAEVVPMDVDEINPLEASSQETNEHVEKANLEKSIVEATSSNILLDVSITDNGIAPDEQKSELVEEIVLQESKLSYENVPNEHEKDKNVSIGKLPDSVFDDKPVEQIEPVKETADTEQDTVSVEVDSTEKETVVADSDCSFKSVDEEPPKSEIELYIEEEDDDIEEIIDADISMELAPAAEQQNEEKMEPTNEANENEDPTNNEEPDSSNVRLPDLLVDKRTEPKKTVVFSTDFDEDEDEKKTKKRALRTGLSKEFPRTPSREKPPLSTVMIKSFMEKERDTPIKPEILKARHSSTPIQKGEEISLSKSTPQPPAQIDAIKPLVEPIQVVAAPSPSSKVVPRRLVSDDDDDDEDDDEEQQHDGDDSDAEAANMSLFVDNEVEVADDNYQSGDSMDSSERREIQEHEVPCDGESVGSQDTIESDRDEDESDESFIVSDNDVGEEDEAADVEDIEPLCWEIDELEEDEEVDSRTSKDKKQRRRIMVVNSSSEEDEDAQEPEPEKLASSSQSCSSNASKLSEAAKLLNASMEDDEHDDPELESSRKIHLNEISKSECFNKTSSRLEISTIEVNTTVEEVSDAESEPEAEAVAETVTEEPKPSTSAPKGDYEEEALLAELASSDLSHLQKMFNPLQKSRRQSLYMPSPEQLANKEPKLKRRSERFLHDFNPSQSFMEVLAEKQRQQPKRQRLSKSFCGTAEDEVLKEELQPVELKSEQTETEIESLPKKEKETIAATTSVKAPAEKKSVDHYMKYCDELLQAASQAKLEQKKLAVAARANGVKKPKKKPQRQDSPTTSQTVEPNPIAVAKKKVKRLAPGEKQAIQKAVNRAIELLAPDLVQKEPQSLARKLSPQPTFANVKAKAEKANNKQSAKQTQKNKKHVASPIKSSDEENHSYQKPIERFKNNAGYVNVYRDDSPPRAGLELIKTRSGIMRVEPCTPTSKYFQEMPPTPKNRKRCFQEVALTPKDRPAKKPKAPEAPRSSGGVAGGRKPNSSTDSAIRFKNRVLSRKV